MFLLVHEFINSVDIKMGTKETRPVSTAKAKGPHPTTQAGISQTALRPGGLSLLEEKDTTMEEILEMNVTDPSSGILAFLTYFDSLEFNSLPTSHFHSLLQLPLILCAC